MSLDAVRMIIQRGTSDKRFRKQLLSTPEVTLRESGLKLTDAERLALEDLIGILREEKPRPPWKLPPFRESIVACLSVILTLLLIGMIWATLTEAKTPMGTVQVGDTMQMYDPFTRSKEVLTLVFPLFTAVISFWFGVTVEGRRADQNLQRAESESIERANAEKSKDQAVTTSTTTMAAAAQMVAPIEQACKAGKAPAMEDVQNLRKKLEEGQNKLTEGLREDAALP